MGSRQPTGLFSKLIARFFARRPPPSENARARQLIAAIDRGGLPLNAAKVNAIARDLGLEVSRRAPVEETVQRIRLALTRIGRHE